MSSPNLCLHSVFQQHPIEQTDGPPAAERRSKVRFPLILPVRYRTIQGETLSGEGWTANMSSSGILVERPHPLSAGALLEMRIDWPSRLDGRIGLQLVAVGRVVRCERSRFAVILHQYQFRTVRSQHASQPRAKQAAD